MPGAAAYNSRSRRCRSELPSWAAAVGESAGGFPNGPSPTRPEGLLTTQPPSTATRRGSCRDPDSWIGSTKSGSGVMSPPRWIGRGRGSRRASPRCSTRRDWRLHDDAIATLTARTEDGQQACSWRPCRSATSQTSRRSGRRSPAATATSWTTSPRKCSSANPNRCACSPRDIGARPTLRAGGPQTPRRCHPRVHLRVTTTAPSIRTVLSMIDSQLLLLTAIVATFYSAVCALILVPSFAVERAAARTRARGDPDSDSA